MLQSQSSATTAPHVSVISGYAMEHMDASYESLSSETDGYSCRLIDIVEAFTRATRNAPQWRGSTVVSTTSTDLNTTSFAGYIK